MHCLILSYLNVHFDIIKFYIICYRPVGYYHPTIKLVLVLINAWHVSIVLSSRAFNG